MATSKAPAVAKLVCEGCRQTIVRVYGAALGSVVGPRPRYWRFVLRDLVTHLKACRGR